MLTLNSENTSSEDPFDTIFHAKIYPYDQGFEKQEDGLIEFNGRQHMESKIFSPEHIKNEVLNLTSKTTSSEDHFETRFQSKIYPSDKSFEKQEDGLI